MVMEKTPNKTAMNDERTGRDMKCVSSPKQVKRRDADAVNAAVQEKSSRLS
jgi:hypothetical protein